MIVVGVDTGGTFTDVIVHIGDGAKGRFVAVKVPSTPDDPAQAIFTGLERLKIMGLPVPDRVVHGSTVATNAILEGKGVKTALVTTAGFRDVLAIGRQNRADLYDPASRRPPCLVPEALRFEAPGRILADGSRREAVSPEAARDIAGRVAAAGAESVAVSLLFSFLDPADERLLGRELAARGLYVSLSHEIIREFREFERASTTVVNACVSPLMARYLSRLETGLGTGTGLCVMQSSGGILTAKTAGRQSVRTILSGPAGGVTAALALARLTGLDRLITFDMGGTSTDVALLDGAPGMTTETVVAGYPVTIPMIDMHTVGAGGGSLAAFDAGGALTVGPRSAGADPGPACYGRGEGLTVTDANLVLGRRPGPDRGGAGRGRRGRGRGGHGAGHPGHLGGARARSGGVFAFVLRRGRRAACRVPGPVPGHESGGRAAAARAFFRSGDAFCGHCPGFLGHGHVGPGPGCGRTPGGPVCGTIGLRKARTGKGGCPGRGCDAFALCGHALPGAVL
jgi:N-methylhydantoinase A